MSVHTIGIIGLIVVFVIGTLRPINLGILCFVATFLVGTLVAGEAPREMYSGFPVDLFVLLAGVTYLFGIAVRNGTVGWIVEESVGAARDRQALIPWVVFGLAALPAMAGALGSAGVALLAPLAMRLAERCDIDRRMVGLMVVHGAAAGNFSPLNVLGAIVQQAVSSRGLELSVWTLFAGNLVYNLVLAIIIVAIFGGRRPFHHEPDATIEAREPRAHSGDRRRLAPDQICTLAALLTVAIVSLGFGLSIGFLSFAAAAALHLAFPRSSTGAERHIAWTVVLLVCGIVTYVGALQRYGTVDAVGAGIAALGSPLVVALLLCAVGAVTSAFASSAGILGAHDPAGRALHGAGRPSARPAWSSRSRFRRRLSMRRHSRRSARSSSPTRATRNAPVVYRGLLAWGAVDGRSRRRS